MDGVEVNGLRVSIRSNLPYMFSVRLRSELYILLASWKTRRRVLTLICLLCAHVREDRLLDRSEWFSPRREEKVDSMWFTECLERDEDDLCLCSL